MIEQILMNMPEITFAPELQEVSSAQLKAQKKKFEGAIEMLDCLIRKLDLVEAKRVYGVELGSVVIDGHGNYIRVTDMICGGGVAPWLVGNPLKKDGNWSKLTRNAYYPWAVVNSEETTC